MINKAKITVGILEETRDELDAQNSLHSVVYSAHRNEILLDEIGQNADEADIVIRNHHLQKKTSILDSYSLKKYKLYEL